jgi:hypothetical protein
MADRRHSTLLAEFRVESPGKQGLHQSRTRIPRQSTVKVPALVAVPPGVVTLIFPVFAPLGTVAVIWAYESTLKLVALTPPKVTLVAPVKLSPLMVTTVPSGSLVGAKLVICGITRNFWLLFSVPPDVVTVTKPVLAPLGTVAVR